MSTSRENDIFRHGNFLWSKDARYRRPMLRASARYFKDGPFWRTMAALKNKEHNRYISKICAVIYALPVRTLSTQESLYHTWWYKWWLDIVPRIKRLCKINFTSHSLHPPPLIKEGLENFGSETKRGGLENKSEKGGLIQKGVPFLKGGGWKS